MKIDVTNFYLVNVTDTCAVWNVLSSATLYRTAKRVKVAFCITSFINYECFIKPRTGDDPNEKLLQERLETCVRAGDFSIQEIHLDDLLNPLLITQARRVGKGEISAIAFAYRTRQAFLSDDKKARAVACKVLDQGRSQTTPHLLGWLFYCRHLIDGDLPQILDEHAQMGRPLGPHFENAYNMALRARCLSMPPTG